MYPHERSLVKKMESKPFALVGVNSDASKEELKRIMEKEKITWRSFFDGGGPGGPIATRWDVEQWPTLVLLDHKGVVRQVWIGWPSDKVLNKELAALLRAAEADRPREK